MDWAVDGTDLTQEPIRESTQEYQDSEFSDELRLSDPAHPLFPTSLWSNSATIHITWGSQDWADSRTQRVGNAPCDAVPLAEAQRRDGHLSKNWGSRFLWLGEQISFPQDRNLESDALETSLFHGAREP